MAFYTFAAISGFTFLVQLLSVFIVFKKVESTENSRYRFFKIQFLVTWGYFFYVFYSREAIGDPLYWIASSVVLACLVLFFYCSAIIRSNKLSIVFSADSPEFHISRGPYAVVRHPFYTSYILTYGALALVAQDILLTVLCLGMFITYYSAARYEEKKFLNSNLKSSYQKYQTQTGMFFPRIAKRQE